MKTRIFLNGLLIALMASVLLVNCSKSSLTEDDGLVSANATGANDSRTVYMKDSKFSKPDLIILAGQTVTWVNNDNITHTVTSNDDRFHSGNMQPGAVFSYTFTEMGDYSYRCIDHPAMTGIVEVKGIK